MRHRTPEQFLSILPLRNLGIYHQAQIIALYLMRIRPEKHYSLTKAGIQVRRDEYCGADSSFTCENHIAVLRHQATYPFFIGARIYIPYTVVMYCAWRNTCCVYTGQPLREK